MGPGARRDSRAAAGGGGRLRPGGCSVRRDAAQHRLRRHHPPPDELPGHTQLHGAGGAVHGQHRPGAPGGVRLVRRGGLGAGRLHRLLRAGPRPRALARRVPGVERGARARGGAHRGRPARDGHGEARALPPAHPLRHRCGARARVDQRRHRGGALRPRLRGGLVHRFRRAGRASGGVPSRARGRPLRHRRRARARDGARVRTGAGGHHPLGRGGRHAAQLHVAIAGAVHPARPLRLREQERGGVRAGARGRGQRRAGRVRAAAPPRSAPSSWGAAPIRCSRSRPRTSTARPTSAKAYPTSPTCWPSRAPAIRHRCSPPCAARAPTP